MDICSIRFFIILISSMLKLSDQLLMKLSPPGPITVEDGATVRINCSVDQRIIQTRTVHWDITGMRQALQRKITQKFISSDTLQIIIKQIRAEDAGPFSCKAENKYGFLLYKNVHILVRSRELSTCGDSTKFQCRSGQCLSLEKRCDSVIQCPDGTDEIGCDSSCRTGFLCNNRQCISIELTCDREGLNHCGDWSDENCDVIPIQEKTPNTDGGVDLDNVWHRTIVFIVVGCILAVLMILSAVVLFMCRDRIMKQDDTCDSSIASSQPPDEIQTLDPTIGASSTATVPITGAMDIHPEEEPELQSLIDSPPPYTKHDESQPEPPRDDAPPPYETFRRGLDDVYNPTAVRSTPRLQRAYLRDNTRSSSVDRVLESTTPRHLTPGGTHSLDDVPPPLATSTMRRPPRRNASVDDRRATQSIHPPTTSSGAHINNSCPTTLYEISV